MSIRFPCQVGVLCPYCHCDDDGMELCTSPDTDPKRRRSYPYVHYLNELECDLLGGPETPIARLIKACDEKGIRENALVWRYMDVEVQNGVNE